MTINGLGTTTPLTSKVEYNQEESKVSGFQEALKSAAQEQDDVQLKEACKQVEQYMLASIFKQMKASTNMGETMIPKGDYEEMFEDYMVDEQCKQMCEAGGIGLADMMYKQMSRGL